MYQRWDDLLFLHWSYDPSAIQSTLPRGLTVDTFEGKAYIGIVPFFMRDVRPSLLPSTARHFRFPGIERSNLCLRRARRARRLVLLAGRKPVARCSSGTAFLFASLLR